MKKKNRQSVTNNVHTNKQNKKNKNKKTKNLFEFSSTVNHILKISKVKNIIYRCDLSYFKRP